METLEAFFSLKTEDIEKYNSSRRELLIRLEDEMHRELISSTCKRVKDHIISKAENLSDFEVTNITYAEVNISSGKVFLKGAKNISAEMFQGKVKICVEKPAENENQMKQFNICINFNMPILYNVSVSHELIVLQSNFEERNETKLKGIEKICARVFPSCSKEQEKKFVEDLKYLIEQLKLTF